MAIRVMSKEEILSCGQAMPRIVRRFEQLVGCGLSEVHYASDLFYQTDADGCHALIFIDTDGDDNFRKIFAVIPSQDDEGNCASNWYCTEDPTSVEAFLDADWNVDPSVCAAGAHMRKVVTRVGYLCASEDMDLWQYAGPVIYVRPTMYSGEEVAIIPRSRNGFGVMFLQAWLHGKDCNSPRDWEATACTIAP